MAGVDDPPNRVALVTGAGADIDGATAKPVSRRARAASSTSTGLDPMPFDPIDVPRGVSVVRPGQHRAAAAAISAGHADYPTFRQLFPDPRRRARALRPFFEATVRDAAPLGSVLAIEDGARVAATAVWLPPGAFPWTAGRKLRAMPAFMRVLLADPRAFPAFMRHGAAVERTHNGDRSWYLVVLSVRPEYQGQGLGTRLVEAVLERADRDGATSELETSDPANIGFYERFGFEVVEGGVPGAPVLTAMRRPPRAHGGPHQGG